VLEVREQPCMMTLSVDERTIHTKEEKLETKIQCETGKERSEERKPESGCIDKFIARNMFWIGMLCELLCCDVMCYVLLQCYACNGLK